jgi:DMSO/TMAO reductase YedYZ molybdopterin-dependent catalytic subunit
MYGYKSIKWLNRIEVTNQVVNGYWEDNGYPANAWIGGSSSVSVVP